MTGAQFQSAVYKAVATLRARAPYDTGNLRYNAIRYYFEGQDTAHILVDESIASYMPYTNEPWISTYWRGRKNPNLYWFDIAAAAIIGELERDLHGKARETTIAADGSIERAAEMVRSMQNKRGDLVAEDWYVNSGYIANTPGISFSDRAALINGG